MVYHSSVHLSSRTQVVLCALLVLAVVSSTQAFSVLIYSETAGYVHASIPAGIAMIQGLAAANGFTADTSIDSADFNDLNLAKYQVVVFLQNSGTSFTAAQQTSFQVCLLSASCPVAYGPTALLSTPVAALKLTVTLCFSPQQAILH